MSTEELLQSIILLRDNAKELVEKMNNACIILDECIIEINSIINKSSSKNNAKMLSDDEFKQKIGIDISNFLNIINNQNKTLN